LHVQANENLILHHTCVWFMYLLVFLALIHVRYKCSPPPQSQSAVIVIAASKLH